MHLSKGLLLSVIFVASVFGGGAHAQSPNGEPLKIGGEGDGETVAERIRLAKRINAEIMNSKLAATKSERLAAENEVQRMMIEARDLASRMNTSASEVDQLRQENERFRRLLSSQSNRSDEDSTPAPQTTSEPPINIRVLNVLQGEGITTRARIMVMGEDGSPQGQFQIKEGSSVQGWNVERIDQNTIRVSKNGEEYTYGGNGLL